jgi:NAD(P)-dependent dehydrogenase (short-subunit alcohol dehydrogenase family)
LYLRNEQMLDLSSFASVRAFAEEAVGDRPLMAVVHNAGVMGIAPQQTVDGHDLTLQVNHLSVHLLTTLLLPNLKLAAEGESTTKRQLEEHFLLLFAEVITIDQHETYVLLIASHFISVAIICHHWMRKTSLA